VANKGAKVTADDVLHAFGVLISPADKRIRRAGKDNIVRWGELCDHLFLMNGLRPSPRTKQLTSYEQVIRLVTEERVKHVKAQKDQKTEIKEKKIASGEFIPKPRRVPLKGQKAPKVVKKAVVKPSIAKNNNNTTLTNNNNNNNNKKRKAPATLETTAPSTTTDKQKKPKVTPAAKKVNTRSQNKKPSTSLENDLLSQIVTPEISV